MPCNMTLKIKYSTLLILLAVTCKLYAQHPVSLYYLENVPQSSLINPALSPRANGFLGIPAASMIYTNYYFDILGPDILQPSSNGNYITLNHSDFDYTPIYNKIGNSANFRVEQSVQDLFFGGATKNGYFTFGITEKATQAIGLPKDFFTILDKGFEGGKTLELGTLNLNSQYYREFLFGYAFKLNNQWQVGVNAKFLQGLVAANTKIEQLNITPGLESWQVQVDGKVNMSAPIEVYTDENNLPDSVSIPDDMMELAMETGLMNFKNPGLAFDAGVVYKLDHHWEFSGSLTDVGFISWHGDVHNFSANGGYNYQGVYIDGNTIDSIGKAFENMLDSAKQAIKLQYSQNGFTTALGPKMYLGAQYNLNHYASFGLLSRSVFFKHDFRQEFTASFNLNLYRMLTTTLNYTVAINGINTIGFGLGLQGGPFQFYLAGDYFPYTWRNYTIESEDDNGNITSQTYPGPDRFQNFNLVLGFNILFGAKGFKNNPMIEAYKEF